MVGTKRNMAIEKKQASSQIGLTKKRSSRQKDDHKLCSHVPPTTFKSLGPTSSTDAVVIDDKKDKKVTLRRKKKKKKQKFVTWWDDDVDGVKALPKSKDAAPVRKSCFNNRQKTKTKKKKKKKKKEEDERSLASSHNDNNFIDLSEDKGNGHVSLEELGVSVEDLKSMPWEAFDPTWEIRSETMDPWLGGYIKDMFSAP